jgi:hypothetical protein
MNINKDTSITRSQLVEKIKTPNNSGLVPTKGKGKTKVSHIGRKCTFPDLTSFPIQSVFDFNDTSTLVCYLNEDTPQVIWVPTHFISND